MQMSSGVETGVHADAGRRADRACIGTTETQTIRSHGVEVRCREVLPSVTVQGLVADVVRKDE